MCPQVSIVIPTYNRRAMLSEAIASVMAQRGADFELIVVDDGSTDGTAEEIDRIAALANTENRERVVLRVVRTENRGVAAARNLGIALASAPLIAFLDSDDLWLPGKLERQLAFMRAHPNFTIAQTEEIWMRGGRRVNPGVRHRKRAGDIFLDSLRTCLISPSAVIIRTELLKKLGGFDERMVAAEDYDLWLRILAAGHEVGLDSEPSVMRRAGHLGQLSATVLAIDRFRILALLKLLATDSTDASPNSDASHEVEVSLKPSAPSGLGPSRRQAVSVVLAEKCAVYAQGLRRRGRKVDAVAIMQIGVRAKNSWSESGRPSIDDAIARMLAIISTGAFGRTAKASGVVEEASAPKDNKSNVLDEDFGVVAETDA
jgi:GT2 family glycosyltransferase